MNKKHKKLKSVVISLACLSTLATAIPFNVLAEETKAKETTSVVIKNNTTTDITVKGKRSVNHYKNIERKNRKFSNLNPTGLYVEPNTPIEIENKGKNQIKAMIGTYSYENGIKPTEYAINPGKQTILSTTGGMLYLINEHNGITVNTTIHGGKKVPFFKMGETTTSEWQEMLETYKNSYAVELVGRNSLITVTYNKAKEHLLNSNPEELLKKHDEVIDLQAEVSGLSKEQKDPNYVHFVEDRYDTSYMKATEYRTAYAPWAIEYVLDKEKLVKEGWGPWHEAGHQRQQIPWRWDGMGEVTVNIYSLYVQTKFGNESRLNSKYQYIFKHLESTDASKNFDTIPDVFVRLGMFWQLHLALGEDFYPSLHEYYRNLPNSSIPGTNETKKQFFVQSASKIANRDLTPFFDKWGFKMTDETRREISQYPALQNNIWESTDNSPVIEDTDAPTAPAGVKASNITSNSATLTFDESTDNVGVKEYKVWDAINKKFVATTTNTSVNMTGLQADTAQSFIVFAYDAAGNKSTGSNVLEFKTEKDQGTPEAPAWDPSKVYSTAGTKVSFGGDVYESRYYINANNAPSALDHHGEVTGWKMIAGPTLEKPFTWNAETVYKNEGGKADRVIVDGKTYEARYWTKGDNPANSPSWGPWELVSQ